MGVAETRREVGPNKNMGGGRLALKNYGKWEVGPKNLWEVGGWHQQLVGGGL